MARWAMIMSEYNYSVEYIKGATNTAADALSRLIKMPDEAWRPLRLEDQDSDENYPFLYSEDCKLAWLDVRDNGVRETAIEAIKSQYAGVQINKLICEEPKPLRLYL